MTALALLCPAILLVPFAPRQASAQPIQTDLNLVIAIDCSYSVNSGEFALQVGGIAAALADPLVIELISRGEHQAIAITVLQWSTADVQKVVLPWSRISGPRDALRAAGLISAMERQTAKGGTSIVGALRRGQALLDNAPFLAKRQVIDIIADGENNNGGRVETMRDRLVGRGTTINALAVRNEVSYLHYYLRNRVIGGTGAFVEQAADYDDFARAFRKKLLREIEGPLFTQLPDKRI